MQIDLSILIRWTLSRQKREKVTPSMIIYKREQGLNTIIGFLIKKKIFILEKNLNKLYSKAQKLKR